MHIDKNNPIKYNLKVTPKSTVYFQFKTKGSKNRTKVNANIHIYYKDIFRIGKNYLVRSNIQSVYTSVTDTIHNIKMQVPEFRNCTQSFVYLWAESNLGTEIEGMKTMSSIEFTATIMKKTESKFINRHKGQKVIKQQRAVLSKPSAIVPKPYVIPSVVSPKITFFVFVGEFGYEILSSHGWLRLLKGKYPNFKIGVASRGGVGFLYEDCCDVYVDITDILSRYMSQGFHVVGPDLSKKDKYEIYRRCSGICKEHDIRMVYSNQRYCENGIEYGAANKGDLIREPSHIQRQKSKLFTLSKYGEEKRRVFGKFPELSKRRYVVLNDRIRDASWGRNNIDENIWKDIIHRLIQRGYLVVLIGYTPYKKKDAYSIFHKGEFKNMPGTVNISDFLNVNIDKNILYQALIIQNAEFYIGVWGSAGYLPPLLGIDSYLLTIERRNFDLIKKDTDLWNKFLSVGKGSIYCLDTTTKKESIMNALERIDIFKGIGKYMLNINNFRSKLSHKKVIYTAIFDDKDDIPFINIIPNDWDLVCFTDSYQLSSNLWKIVYTKGNQENPTRSARHFKLQPHIFFPNHDISIWIDGNFHILCDINNLLDTNNNYDFIGLAHNDKINGIYHEGERCIKKKKDNPIIIKSQLERYRKEGFPENCDVLSSSMLIRKHNLEHIITFDNAWFEELKNGSTRDQLSFSYVAKKLNFIYGKIKDDNRFRRVGHKK